MIYGFIQAAATTTQMSQQQVEKSTRYDAIVHFFGVLVWTWDFIDTSQDLGRTTKLHLPFIKGFSVYRDGMYLVSSGRSFSVLSSHDSSCFRFDTIEYCAAKQITDCSSTTEYL